MRVDYTGPLGYELGAYLDPLHYELWRTPADNARIAAAILTAATQPRPRPRGEKYPSCRPTLLAGRSPP